MVDAAVAVLADRGVARAHMHCDRFTPQHDAAPAADARLPARVDAAPSPWDALHYLKFFLFHGVGLLAAFALLVGGPAISLGLVTILAFYMVGDAVCGEHRRKRQRSAEVDRAVVAGVRRRLIVGEQVRGEGEADRVLGGLCHGKACPSDRQLSKRARAAGHD